MTFVGVLYCYKNCPISVLITNELNKTNFNIRLSPNFCVVKIPYTVTEYQAENAIENAYRNLV